MDTVERLPLRDGELVVYEAGEGPTLTYLHGMIGNPGIHPFIKELAKHNRVVAPCLPGFSGSTPDHNLVGIYDWVSVLSEILDACSLAGQPIVAASVGAMVALELQSVRPEAFSHMALIAPMGLWDDEMPVADVFAQLKSEQRAILMTDPDRSAVFWEDRGLSADDRLQHGIDRYHTRRAAASLVWPIPDHGLGNRLHRVSCPVGLIWGEDDQVVDPAYADRYTDRLSGPTFSTRIENAGHLVEWDQPAATARAVWRALSM